MIIIGASVVMAVFVLIAVAVVHPWRPAGATVATCTAEIVAHPHEAKAGPGCRGLSPADMWQATLQAMAEGARG
jgi:hypothetical protein